jgi:hypothetical protein
MKYLYAVLAISIIATESHAAKWVNGNRNSCDVVCLAKNANAVSPGAYTNGEPYYVCRTDAEGRRPGYNLQPEWANSCTVGVGGEERASPEYQCLCE